MLKRMSQSLWRETLMAEGSQVRYEKVQVWRCSTCGGIIGLVTRGDLMIGAARVVRAVVECPECGHTRKWYPGRPSPPASLPNERGEIER
jgi:hypothetical protein